MTFRQTESVYKAWVRASAIDRLSASSVVGWLRIGVVVYVFAFGRSFSAV